MSSYANQNRRKLTAFAISVASSIVLVVAFLAFTRLSAVLANTPDINNVRNRYPAMVNTAIDSCSLCHTSSIPALNAYGAAYKSNGRSLAALAAIEGQDSDGDGFTNLQEISALSFPGDAASRPAAPTATATKPPTATATRTPTTSPTNQPSATPTQTATPTQPTGSTPTQTVTPTLPTQMTPTKTASPTPTVVCKEDGDNDKDDRGRVVKPTKDKDKKDKIHCEPEDEKDRKQDKERKERKRRGHGSVESFDLFLSRYDGSLPDVRMI